MLSLVSGEPIARLVGNPLFPVRGSKYKQLGIIEPDRCGYDGMKEDFMGSNGVPLFEPMKVNAVKKSNKEIFAAIRKKKPTDIPTKSIMVKQGEFEPVPDKSSERQTLFVVGASGSGKSYFTSMWCRNYIATYPDRCIYLFSTVASDQCYQDLEDSGKMIRIIFDESLIESIEDGSAPMCVDLENSCVVLDDLEAVRLKPLKNYLDQLRNQILTVGRHKNVSCITIFHDPTKGHETKLILTESSMIVVFPQHNPKNKMKYLLTQYCGLEPDEINLVHACGSRWVAINRHCPRYILWDKGGYAN